MFNFPASFTTFRRRSLAATPFLLLALSAVVPASATMLIGTLAIGSGPISATGVGNQATVDATTIKFGGGIFSVTGGTGSFTPPPFDAPLFTGKIKNLDSALANQPTGTPFVFPNFLTFDSDLPTSFELRYIFVGTNGIAGCSAAIPMGGQVCTPGGPGAGSPFNLQNNSPTQSTASFTVKGLVYNGPDVMNFTGIFTTPFPTQSFQDVLAVLSSKGSVTAPYAAQFTITAVPEPGSFALVGVTLAGAAALRRRRRA